MSLFLLGKRIHIPVFEQNMMAKIAKKTIQFKFTIFTFVLTWFPHWVAGPWLLMHVPFPPNKELCTLSSGSGASFSWRLGWGNSPQCPAVCTRVVPTHRRRHPSFSRSCESFLLHGTPWGRDQQPILHYGALPTCNLAEQFDSKLVLKRTATGKFGVLRVHFFGQSRLLWFVCSFNPVSDG